MTDLTKLQDLASKLPDSVRDKALALVERMGSSIEGLGDTPQKWRPGNVRLIQATTDRSKLPKGANIGSLVLGEDVLPTPLRVIVLSTSYGRQMWSPDQSEGKVLCSSPDGVIGGLGYDCKVNCPHAVFNEETRRSECGTTYTALVINDDLSNVFAITFSKTNYAVGSRDLHKAIKEAGVAIYRRVYGISTKTNAQYKQVESYSIDKFQGKEKETPVEYIPFLEELFRLIRSDRQEMLTEYHKNAMEKRAGNPSLKLVTAPADTQSDTVLVESKVEESHTSELAAKYKV